MGSAWTWNNISGGLLATLAAGGTRVLPLAGSAAQLGRLLPHWPQTEQRLIAPPFPGSWGWAAPGLLQHLWSLGFASELPYAEAMAHGATCRACRWESIKH
eukprot:800197-Pyramimonas_sp.AAC.1